MSKKSIILMINVVLIIVLLVLYTYQPSDKARVAHPALTARYRKPYKFTSDMFSVNAWHWPSTLETFKGKPNLHYLEIGVFEGASLLWMLENILTDPSSWVTAIDIFPGDLEEKFIANLEMSGFREKVKILKGPSQQQLRSLQLNSFDIVYIDGSHVAKHVYLDAALSWDLLKTGGLLIFDDYLYVLEGPSDQRPKAPIDAFIHAFGDELELVHKDYQLVVRKKGTFCRRYHCSTIGNYGYDWIERALYQLDNDRLITLSEKEKLALERVLRVYVDVRHDNEALAGLKQRNQDFLMLNKKLNLIP